MLETVSSNKCTVHQCLFIENVMLMHSKCSITATFTVRAYKYFPNKDAVSLVNNWWKQDLCTPFICSRGLIITNSSLDYCILRICKHCLSFKLQVMHHFQHQMCDVSCTQPQKDSQSQ